ncbi:MAG: two-component transcriptional regulator LuxR family [Hyphomicrobiales bacterium]|nr:two-component transcriptional regulator LuxR family [Hyphomicrobiales bacterium]
MDDFSRVVHEFGFNHYVVAGLPAAGEDPESLVVVNKWPTAWLDRYREQAYFYDDPVTQWSFSQNKPFFWDEARAGSPVTKRATIIAGEASDMGLVDGMGFPMADPDHWQAVVSLASDTRCRLDRRQKGLMYLASVLFQGRAMEMLRHEMPTATDLTPRQREILSWVANGKSIWDVSMILGISEDTVEYHLRGARKRLRVVNTTHAVARALHLRQIRL